MPVKFLNEMEDLFGQALWDYYHNTQNNPLILHHPFGEPYQLDLEGYFFGDDDFSEMEQYALSLCNGKTLDVGAAAGRHALWLQENNETHVLDISDKCCEIMKRRGVHNIIRADIFKLTSKEKYDNILLMLNGIGICGDILCLERLLAILYGLTNRSGKVIFDSSNIEHLYSDIKVPGYFGEVAYRYQYGEKMGSPFKWLYIDIDKMQFVAKKWNWRMQVIYEDDDNGYLALLTK
ncbi:MAG TPA: SAM-dependent methyltransferase [Cytophagales bacterium]|nr:SAM-dependent methyltransferase [Cytophagales bacterium]